MFLLKFCQSCPLNIYLKLIRFDLEHSLACKKWEDVDNASIIRAEQDDWTGLGHDADEM